MNTVITFFNSIECPIEMVQTGVLEVFAMHRDAGNLIAISHSLDEYYHYAQFNTSSLPKNVSNISFSLHLSASAEIGNRTLIKGIVEYTHRKECSLSRFIKRAVLKQQIKLAVSIRFHQFRDRMENQF
ncbi:MAG: hypothetical protein AAFO99_09000 [Bacteroidota bacterium]